MGFLFKDRKKENKNTGEKQAGNPYNSSAIKSSEPPGKAENAGTAPQPHKPHTLGQLKASGYKPLPIREEMRRNLIVLIKARKPIFNGIISYDNTVIPQVENAVLLGQNIIF